MALQYRTADGMPDLSHIEKGYLFRRASKEIQQKWWRGSLYLQWKCVRCDLWNAVSQSPHNDIHHCEACFGDAFDCYECRFISLQSDEKYERRKRYIDCYREAAYRNTIAQYQSDIDSIISQCLSPMLPNVVITMIAEMNAFDIVSIHRIEETDLTAEETAIYDQIEMIRTVPTILNGANIRFGDIIRLDTEIYRTDRDMNWYIVGIDNQSLIAMYGDKPKIPIEVTQYMRDATVFYNAFSPIFKPAYIAPRIPISGDDFWLCNTVLHNDATHNHKLPFAISDDSSSHRIAQFYYEIDRCPTNLEYLLFAQTTMINNRTIAKMIRIQNKSGVAIDDTRIITEPIPIDVNPSFDKSEKTAAIVAKLWDWHASLQKPLCITHVCLSKTPISNQVMSRIKRTVPHSWYVSSLTNIDTNANNNWKFGVELIGPLEERTTIEHFLNDMSTPECDFLVTIKISAIFNRSLVGWENEFESYVDDVLLRSGGIKTNDFIVAHEINYSHPNGSAIEVTISVPFERKEKRMDLLNSLSAHLDYTLNDDIDYQSSVVVAHPFQPISTKLYPL